MVGIRTNHTVRLRAFALFEKLKAENVPRRDIVNIVHNKFSLPRGTIYCWYKGDYLPNGRKGKIMIKPELFYVLGALLGDGCIYNWKITRNYVILVGDRIFTKKYSKMLASCISKVDKPYIIRSKNVWFVRSNNFELYSFFKKARENSVYLENLLAQTDMRSKLLFVEGFFDAEGCVKIIKEKVRRTPKICLDITNTNYGFLESIRKILNEASIISAYSIQEPKDDNRKRAYHLRVYKKECIKRFFENISTTKLKEEKIIYLKNWLSLNAATSLA